MAALAAALGGFRSGNSIPGAGPMSSAPFGGARAQRQAGRRLLRRTLKFSVAEGIAAEIVTACAGGAVLTGWALHLGASPFVIGVLAALPFLSQWVHFPAAALTSRFGGRKVAVVAVALSRQVLWPLAALPLVPISDGAKQGVLITVAAVSALLGVVGNNAWTTWMGDLVPVAVRGRYFGRRSSLCMLAGAVGTFGAGSLLDAARASGHAGSALSMLAILACVAGAISTFLMVRQHDPNAPRPLTFTLEAVLRPLRDDRARRLLAYLVPWNVAIGVSSAFFAVYELQNLGLGFRAIALLGILTATMRLLMAPLWGRAIDRLGARPVLVASSFLIVFIPLIWLFATPDRWWPVIVDAIVAGAFWSGHNLASFQMPLALAPREGRAFFLAAFSSAAGLPFACAAAMGGVLATTLPPELTIGGHRFANLQLIFVLSSVLRLVASFIALRLTEPGAQSVGELGRMFANEAAQQPSKVLRPILEKLDLERADAGERRVG